MIRQWKFIYPNIGPYSPAILTNRREDRSLPFWNFQTASKQRRATARDLGEIPPDLTRTASVFRALLIFLVADGFVSSCGDGLGCDGFVA
jgi:hypothetical protein